MAIVMLLAKLVRLVSLKAEQGCVLPRWNCTASDFSDRVVAILDRTIKTQLILSIDYVLQRSPSPERPVLA